MFKGLLQINKKRSTIQQEKWAKDMNDQYTKAQRVSMRNYPLLLE